jgi:hypothetical protein
MSRTTQYLRGKTRERGGETAHFMTDGFDRWAESETPASFNSMEKLPTELIKETMASGIRYSKSLDGMVGSARKRKGKRGGAWYDDIFGQIQSGVGQVTNEFTNPESVLQGQYLPALGNEFTNKDSLLRGQYLGQAADGVSKAAPIIDMLAEQMGLGKGVGKTMAEVLKGAQEVNKAASSVGLGRRRKGGKGALDYVSEYVPESKDAISQAKAYAPLLKLLLKGQAPQYSSQIDEGAKFLGLGKKKGKKGGFFGSMFPGVAQQLVPQPAMRPMPMPITGLVNQFNRPQEVKTRGGRATQYGREKMEKELMSAFKTSGGRKPSARAEIVKRVMAERGCSLPQASSIVKREGLY